MKYKFGDKIRRIRKRKGMTMKQVSQLAGISESMISQIECNRISPAIDTLLTVADILNIDMDYLFKDYKCERQVKVIRSGERERISRKGLVYELLSSTPEDDGEYGIEAYLLEVSSGYGSSSESYGHKGKELGFILSGEGELHIGNEIIKLKSGDSVSFSSDLPHSLHNNNSEPMRAFWVTTPPKSFSK